MYVEANITLHNEVFGKFVLTGLDSLLNFVQAEIKNKKILVEGLNLPDYMLQADTSYFPGYFIGNR